MKKQLNSPLFSVIIPLYNKESYILNTLNSVYSQILEDFEVIIINDGSTDNSPQIVEQYISDKSNFNLVSIKNNGVSNARNQGINIAKGEFIALLDADDIWLPNHLRQLKLAINQHPEIKIFYANYCLEKRKGKYSKTKFSYLPKEQNGTYLLENYFRSSLLHEIAWTSAVCLNREFITNNNLYFDTELVSNQDTDLWLRLALKNHCIFIESPTAIYKCYGENGLAKSKLIDNKHLLIKKHADKELSTPYLKEYLDQNRFSIALQYLKTGADSKAFNLFKDISPKNLPVKRKVFYYLPNVLKRLLFKH